MERDRNTPNQAANEEKAEGYRSTVQGNDPDVVDHGRPSDEMQGSEQSGGITNRPLEEETANQEAVPRRGDSREGAHAGHGDRLRKETL